MMTPNEISRIVAEHYAMSEDRRVFHDPPKIAIPQHCMECGQDMLPVVFGWDLLKDAAIRGDGLPVRIATICDRCQGEGGQS